MNPLRLFCSAAFVLATAIAPAVAEKPTVAIFDFDLGTTVKQSLTVKSGGEQATASAEASAETSLLTNKLITALTESDEVIVVEREKISTLMEESSLSQSDLTDPAKATEIGKLLGADYMIFGSISLYDGEVNYRNLPYNAGVQKIMSFIVGADTRLVNSETGQIEAAASLQAEKQDKQLNPAGRDQSIPGKFRVAVYSDLTTKIAQRMMSTLNPIKVAKLAGDTAYLNRGNLKRGSTYTVVKLGEVIRDPDNPEIILGQTESPVCVIEVVSGLPQLSQAKVLKWLGDQREVPAGSICRPVFEEDE